MSDRAIKDYEWASVGRYITHVEQKLGLTQIGLEKVFSFRLTKSGPKGLLGAKRSLVSQLKENNTKLCVYVGGNKDTLGQPELDVLRGMYRSNLDAISTMDSHIDRLQKMAHHQTEIGNGNDDDSDIPF